jgi:NADH dehydrogenase/NADH:ubiquinone oxidoreductase subunit G
VEEISVNVDGKDVAGRPGDSILQICQSNGIPLPTLCHLDGLSSHGGCRLCLVEVDGQRRPVPACTTPATGGMKIQTRTGKLQEHRRMILELLLSERNHFCFLCEKTGDCELQSMCYEFGIDHSPFPAMYPRMELDSSLGPIAIDNSRCILCGRCVRVCSEIVGNNTLGFARRGSETVINEADVMPLSQSNCVECGACTEVCPTGAIFSKLSSYLGREGQCEIVATTCQECPAGCQLRIYKRDNNIVKILGGGLDQRFGGQLCRTGRFDLLARDHPRILCARASRENGDPEECEGAPERAAEILLRAQNQYGRDAVALVISPRATNESVRSFRKLARDLGTRNIFLLEPEAGCLAYTLERGGQVAGCTAEEVSEAGTVILLGVGESDIYPVLASSIRRALNRGGTLVSVGNHDHCLSGRIDLEISPEGMHLRTFLDSVPNLLDLSERGGDLRAYDAIVGRARACGCEAWKISALLGCIGSGRKTVVIAGLALEPDGGLMRSVLDFAFSVSGTESGKAPLIWLRRGANVTGALHMLGDLPVRCLAAGEKLSNRGVKAAYVLACDEEPSSLDGLLEDVGYLVVQASYTSKLSERAIVVLPSPIWSERSGRTTDFEGNVLRIGSVIPRPEGIAGEEKAIEMIRSRLAKMGGEKA